MLAATLLVNENTARSSEQRFTRSAQIERSWQRVRRLFHGTVDNETRLDVHVQRPADEVEAELMVGVDDVQVLPVLSQHPELAVAGGLETALYVPRKAELAELGLEHLLRGGVVLAGAAPAV